MITKQEKQFGIIIFVLSTLLFNIPTFGELLW